MRVLRIVYGAIVSIVTLAWCADSARSLTVLPSTPMSRATFSSLRYLQLFFLGIFDAGAVGWSDWFGEAETHRFCVPSTPCGATRRI